jgi:hypothetical protein
MTRAWDAGRKEGRWDHQHLSAEEERRTQKAIADTMKSVVADQLAGRAYDPWRGSAGGPKATPAGAVVATVPCEGVAGEPQPSKPWKPMHPVQDWLRLGTNVPDVRSANIASAEAQLAKLEKEEE